MIRALLAWLLMTTPAISFPVERCMNLSNALEAPYEGAWGYRIRDADIVAIAEDGFDAIRLPVRFSAKYEAARIDPALLQRVDQVIRTAFDNGLTVILDFHHFEELMTDPDIYEQMFVDIWTELAAHYEGWPPELMFELLNEPSENLTTARADQMFDRVIPIIRKTHPTRWIVVGGGDWSHWEQLKNLAPRDAHTAYTFHYYTPFDFTHQDAEWVSPSPSKRPPMTDAEADAIRQEFATLAKSKAPLFLGEFGVYHKSVPPEHRAPWMEVVRREAENAGIAWCHWGYTSGFRVADDHRAWFPGLKEALFD